MPNGFYVDWLHASNKDVACLYQVTKQILDENGLHWNYLYQDIVIPPFTPGVGYEGNFGAGKISRKKAHQIARWISKNYPAHAEKLEEDIYLARMSESDKQLTSPWADLLEAHGQFQNVEVFPYEAAQRGIVDFAKPEPLLDLELGLGEKFYFRITSEAPGVLGALQQFRGHWYLLPLMPDKIIVPVKSEQTAVPLHKNSIRIAPLAEKEDIGGSS